MASPNPTKGPKSRYVSVGGFTLVEVMMVTMISAFVFSGVLSAYMFLGRGLSRQVNEEDLESRTRLALFWFTQDISSATSIQATNPGSGVTGTMMLLTLPSGATEYYMCDWSGGAGKGILNRRTGTSGPTLALLKNITSFSLVYYDPAGNVVTAPATASSPQMNIKQVYMTYTTTAGVASTGNQSNLTVISSKVTMKNKGALTDPTTP
jgi:Tfp pilus assembly protein PilW